MVIKLTKHFNKIYPILSKTANNLLSGYFAIFKVKLLLLTTPISMISKVESNLIRRSFSLC